MNNYKGKYAVSGIVESIGEDGVVRGWVVRKDQHEKIFIKVNGVTIATAAPFDRVKFNGKLTDCGFSRKLIHLWRFLGSGDRIEFEYCQSLLPIVGHGFRYIYKPRNYKESNVAQMLQLIEKGHVFNKRGALKLSIQHDEQWQQSVLTEFNKVKNDVKAQFGYELYPTYGTMLGVIREQNFISHDDDFDATYISRENTAEKVVAEFEQICAYLIDKGYNLVVRSTHMGVQITVRESVQKLDIFYSWFTPEGKYQISFGHHGPELSYDDDFFNLVNQRLGSFEVALPKNSEDQLLQLYGPDWRIPNPGFSHRSRTRKWDKTFHVSPEKVVAFYWKTFYRNNKLSGASSFAEFVAKTLTPFSKIVELGCGAGQDALFFAQHGHEVIAADRSAEAVKQGQGNTVSLPNIKFFVVDAANKEQINSFFSRAFVKESNSDKENLLYMRFFLHSVPKDTQDIILQATQVMPSGAKVLLEFRTEKDATEKHYFGTHYRRFIPMEEMLTELSTYGFKVLHAEESRGLSPYKDEDPYLCRIIAIKE